MQPVEKTVIDRCVHQIYQIYFESPVPENMPVLQDLYLSLIHIFDMYEKDGQPLEVVAKHFYAAKFKRPKTRPYNTKNYYALLVQQADVEMEVNRIVQNSRKADSEE